MKNIIGKLIGAWIVFSLIIGINSLVNDFREDFSATVLCDSEQGIRAKSLTLEIESIEAYPETTVIKPGRKWLHIRYKIKNHLPEDLIWNTKGLTSLSITNEAYEGCEELGLIEKEYDRFKVKEQSDEVYIPPDQTVYMDTLVEMSAETRELTFFYTDSEDGYQSYELKVKVQ